MTPHPLLSPYYSIHFVYGRKIYKSQEHNDMAFVFRGMTGERTERMKGGEKTGCSAGRNNSQRNGEKYGALGRVEGMGEGET